MSLRGALRGSDKPWTRDACVRCSGKGQHVHRRPPDLVAQRPPGTQTESQCRARSQGLNCCPPARRPLYSPSSRTSPDSVGTAVCPSPASGQPDRTGVPSEVRLPGKLFKGSPAPPALSSPFPPLSVDAGAMLQVGGPAHQHGGRAECLRRLLRTS